MTSALIGGRRRSRRSTGSAGRLPIVSRLSASFFTVKDAGHFPHLQASETLIGLARGFLGE